ncbi:MAG: PucC family protein [Rhodobacteraceae bacterium]|nr:PucC family protein [Paracoccaceae bacterium]
MSALRRISLKYLPFADAASDGLPMGRLLRLSLFQVSVGMAGVLLLGTLNRVMIVELRVPAVLVAVMVALPVLIAPFRALLGFKSDNYRSSIGWRRVPYLWFGSLWQFGGLALMPSALLVLGGDVVHDIPFAGEVLATMAFTMTGLGMHMTQTAGLALAADRASDEARPRVVALLYVMFLVGMGISAVLIGWLLADFTALRLIKVVQSAAVVTILLNVIALWKQERVRPMSKEERAAPRPGFADAWRDYVNDGSASRLLAVVFLGTVAFNMQDVLLEPYGGEILGLSVSATTFLTATWAAGALVGFGLAAKGLAQGHNPYRLAALGILAGVMAFSAVIFANPMNSVPLFFAGACVIGFGGGLFAVTTLTAAMTMPAQGAAGRGLALGAWGAAQATAGGLSIAIGGGIRDLVNQVALSGSMGAALNDPATGYSVVYHLEILLLFITLTALGPLVRTVPTHPRTGAKLGLAELPA